jgi:hypothetical protein
MNFSDYIARSDRPLPSELLCAGAYLLHCCERGEFPTYRGAIRADCHLKAGVLPDLVRDARDLHWVTHGHSPGEALVGTTEGLEELRALRVLWEQAQRPFWWGAKRGYAPQPFWKL